MLALLLACIAPPAVVVVTVDTLRADADLSSLPDGARQYTHAYSAAPYTTSSTAALVSGRYPLGRERGWPGGGPPPCGEDHREPQSATWPREAWPDLVLTDQPVPAMMAGLPIEPFDGPGSQALYQRGSEALSSGARAIYLHSVGAHNPYDGLIDGEQSEIASAHMDAVACGTDPAPEVAAWAVETYHRRAVPLALDGLPELVTAAREAGSVVVVTADHGEALGEGGRWGHGRSLDDEQVRVPLLVWGPGVVPGVDDQPVPATCIGQTARIVTGTAPAGCDLRTGDVRGVVEVGMMVGEEWVTRRPGTEDQPEED